MKHILIIFILTLTSPLPASCQQKNKMTDETGRELLARWLENFSGSQGGLIVSITEAPFASAFPACLFYVLRYRQYPVARTLPEPLTYNNLFVVQPDGKVELLSDTNALEAFFRSALAPVQNKEQAKDVVRAWLRLTEEFHQDGFFDFIADNNALAAVQEGKAIKGWGKIRVMPDGGNSGEITVTLVFDRSGKLMSASETGSVVAGRRPGG